MIFKTAAAAILDFQKFEILTVDQEANVRQRAKFHQNRSNVTEIWRFVNVFLQNGGRPPSWICWVPTGDTHDDHLVVRIVLQNLVEIDAVVSIT